MTIIDTLTFDDQTADAAVTLAAPWSINGTAPVATAASAHDGALGASWASTATGSSVRYDFGTVQTGQTVFSFYMRPNTLPAGVIRFASVYDGAGAELDDLVLNGGTLSVGSGGSNTAAATFDSSTWYRFEWMVNQTAATQEVRVYEGNGTTPLYDLTSGWPETTTQVFGAGSTHNASGGALDYDTIRVSDDWAGPYTPGAPRPTGTVTVSTNNLAKRVITAASGTGPYTYVIDPTTNVEDLGDGEYLITQTETAQSFTVTITDSALQSSDPITVNVPATGISTSWAPLSPQGTLPSTTWA